jgi:hypothetical protein
MNWILVPAIRKDNVRRYEPARDLEMRSAGAIGAEVRRVVGHTTAGAAAAISSPPTHLGGERRVEAPNLSNGTRVP